MVFEPPYFSRSLLTFTFVRRGFGAPTPRPVFVVDGGRRAIHHDRGQLRRQEHATCRAPLRAGGAGEEKIYMTDIDLSKVAESDVQAAEELHQKHLLITEQMRGVIVGQDEVIEQLLVALLCRGHCI